MDPEPEPRATRCGAKPVSTRRGLAEPAGGRPCRDREPAKHRRPRPSTSPVRPNLAHRRRAVAVRACGLVRHPQSRLLPLAAERLPTPLRPAETVGRLCGRLPLQPPRPPGPALRESPRKPESGKRVTERDDVPGPIRPVAFFQNLERYYGIGAEASVAVYRGGDGEGPDLEPIPLDRILCKDLSDWSPPPPGHVAINVRLGRLAFAPGETPGEGVRVSCHHGFSADIGGGAYDRRSSLTAPGPEDFAAVIARAEPSPAPPLWFSSLSDALAAWNPAAHPRAVLTIADSATYEAELTLAPAGRQHLIIQAANRQRPTLRLRDAGAPGPSPDHRRRGGVRDGHSGRSRHRGRDRGRGPQCRAPRVAPLHTRPRPRARRGRATALSRAAQPDRIGGDADESGEPRAPDRDRPVHRRRAAPARTRAGSDRPGQHRGPSGRSLRSGLASPRHRRARR